MNQVPNNDEIATAKRVAVYAASKWNGVEAEDVTSHLWLWLCENAARLKEWRAEEGDGKLYVSLRREAAKYCAAEQAARIGRPITDDNFYNFERVANALPFIFEDTPQLVLEVSPFSGRAVGRVAAVSEAQVIITDIRQGYHGLPKADREVLAWRYYDGLTYRELGGVLGMTKDGAKKYTDRAVRRLVDALAGDLPKV